MARDPVSGALGVAVQSHWFSVGSVVTWARPGVGVVATQSVAEPAYGPRCLDRLAAGEAAPSALAQELAADPLAAVRQVAVVDAAGEGAVHTGADCIPFASHVAGDGWSCQANMMARETVPAAMAEAFTSASGPLPSRFLAAMEAAEAEGGDVRGRQSAAMLIVSADAADLVPTLELRVEDHADPIGELSRLLVLHRAYALAEEADQLLGAGDAAAAGALYRSAAEMAPESDELLFWAGLSLAQAGDVEAGASAVRRASEVHAGWLDLLDRLSDEFAPAGAAVRAVLRR